MIRLKQYSTSLESHGGSLKFNLEYIARLCHDIMRVFNSSIGDDSLTSWDSTAEETKNSTRKGVAHLILNPSTTPEETHEKWVEDKRCEGWSHGQYKDPDSKTHPCMVPYFDLGVEHRLKDHLFRNTVLSVLGTLSEEERQNVSTECDCESSYGKYLEALHVSVDMPTAEQELDATKSLEYAKKK